MSFFFFTSFITKLWNYSMKNVKKIMAHWENYFAFFISINRDFSLFSVIIVYLYSFLYRILKLMFNGESVWVCNYKKMETKSLQIHLFPFFLFLLANTYDMCAQYSPKRLFFYCFKHIVIARFFIFYFIFNTHSAMFFFSFGRGTKTIA